MTTAAEIITNAMRLFGIVDQTEDPTPADIAKNVVVLNNMLRAEMADAACQFLMRTVNVTLPAGVNGQIYTFQLGNQQTTYLLQADILAVKAIWLNDTSLTVNRETRSGPKADVVRTTYPGIITKWHQERQADGSVLVYAWQPPNRSVVSLIEYGARLAPITATDGSDVVALPPEGIDDAGMLLGRRICTSYGRSMEAVGVIAQDAERVDMRWRTWARGQQWLRFVRS